MRTNVYGSYSAKDRSKLVSLLVCTGGAVILGLLAVIFGRSYIGFSGLSTPPLTPPDMLFLAVSPFIYALLGYSLHRVITKPAFAKETARYKKLFVALWIAGFIISMSWIPLFFIARFFIFTFIWLTLLLSVTVTQTVLAFKIDKPAFLSLIPCCIWTGYMVYLNLFITILN